MKSFRPLIAALLLVGAVKSSADSVALNGFCALFGNNLGFLVLYQPAAAEPVNFTLAEGESKFGITLVAVEAEHHRVQIEQCGVKRFLYVQGMPLGGAASEVSQASNTSSTENGTLTDADERILKTFLSSSEAQRIQAGSAVWLGGVTTTKSAGDQTTGNDSTRNNSTSNTSTASDTAKEKGGANTTKAADPEPWYLESLDIERDRLATAEAVYAHQATPLPRTPLTPPNTPARLIGRETFYSNRIPGYILPGYTQPLASLP
jgi:hypothetical protein